MLIVLRMASGGHRIQGEHYHNQDVHFTVACLRARKSQLSPRDAYYQQIQPERCELKPQDDKMHGMPKYSKFLLYNNKYNHIRDSIQEEKAELKRKLQHVQRCEVDAEIQRQKRAEQWRHLVIKEEREERERKRKIEKLQKLIAKEMQKAHHRYHTDINTAELSTSIPSSHIDFEDSSKIPCCSSATNEISETEVATDAFINVEADSHTQQDVMPPAARPPTDQQEACVEDLLLPDRKDDAALKEIDSTEQPTVETDSADTAEQTSPSSISTNIDVVPHDDSATVDKVELASTVIERDADLHFRDQVITSASEEPSIKEKTDQSSVTTTVEIDSPDVTPDDITTVEPDSPDGITTAETDSSDNTTTAATDITDDITIAETDNHGDTTTAETDNHDAITTVTVTTEPPQRTPVTTELQIQQTGVAVIRQSEANEESEATLMVQITTDVTKTQQCHNKELQTQATTVSMTQPTATQDSESTIQFTTDSDTRSGPYDTKFWYHLCNTDGINKTPESMSTVFICCYSEYSCVILYLLLYS